MVDFGTSSVEFSGPNTRELVNTENSFVISDFKFGLTYSLRKF